MERMEDYNPKVSIVIPAYNASNYLAEAIESALAQTYRNFEIIVVNDGSNDDGATAAVAARYGDKIRYFEKENGGSSSALNVGIQNMSGEWFSWLSHDDLYYPEKLEKQFTYMQMLDLPKTELSSHIFFGGTDFINDKGDLIRSYANKVFVEREKTLRTLPGNQYLMAEPTRYIYHGCSCLIHRDVFSQAGMFDEGLRLLNDVELWYRLYSLGYHIHYVPELLVRGRIHSHQVSRKIGFSYHNDEQDRFWTWCLAWLKENYPNDYRLFYLFGKNAYLKTRNREGDAAFKIAASLAPRKKAVLFIQKITYRTYAAIYTFGKKVYLKLKV